MEKTRCPRCGFDGNEADAKSCVRCGAALRGFQAAAPPGSRPASETPQAPTVVVKAGQKPPAVSEPPTAVVKPGQESAAGRESPTVVVKAGQKPAAVPEPPTAVVKPEQKAPAAPEAPTMVAKAGQKPPAVSEPPTAVVKPGQKPAAVPEPPTALVKPEQKAPAVPEAPTVAPVKAKLIIRHGGREGHEFPVTQESITLGRWDADSGAFPEIDLTYDDPESRVSRRHARIFLKDNKYFIEDFGSVNGTFINKGPRLNPGSPHELNSGDEIIVGRVFLSFVIE